MGRFVNRTTKAYVPRGHTPDFPVEDWIQNPNLDNVIGVAEKYWKITGDKITEMSQAEKDVVDLAEKTAEWDRKEANIERNELKAVVTGLIKEINPILSAGGLSTINAASLKARIRAELEKQ